MSSGSLLLLLGAVGTAGCWLLGCAAPPPPAAATGGRGSAVTDLSFSFAAGTPAGGRRLTACGRITLRTTGTERAGATAFRIAGAPTPAEVSLSFDRAISAFDLTVAGLHPGDTLGDFNVGSPPRLSGNLVQTADGQVTAGRGTGSGTLSWPELDAHVLQFIARANSAGPAMTFESFRVACRTAAASGP